MSAPKINLTVGISGSGKSHFAATFCKVKNVVELNLDNYRKMLSGNISDQNVSADAVKVRDNDMVAHLAGGHDVMLSDTNLEASRINSLAKRFPYNELYVYFIKDSEDKELCKTRIADDLADGIDRSNVPNDVVDKQYERFLKVRNATFNDNVHLFEVNTAGEIRAI